MEKISMKDVSELLEAAAPALRKLAAERDTLKEKVAKLERKEEAEKIASAMHHKGIDLDTPFETLVERLEKAAEQGKLEQIQAAVDMVGPDMGTKMAQIANGEDRITAGSSEFERFIVGAVG
jgi:predicted transcriptional regulator